MDKDCKQILNLVGIEFNDINDSNEIEALFFPREQLLSQSKYEEIKKLIPELKKNYSSSFMTSLQKNAEKSQKWPLLNLIRQILHIYGYNMEPIRKADGYTLEGVKKYKRYFLINKKLIQNTEIKKIEINNLHNNEIILISE